MAPQLDGHEFEQALRVGDGQESLAWCSTWGCKVLDTTKQLNWIEKHILLRFFFSFSTQLFIFPTLFFFIIHFCLWWVSVAVWALSNCSKQGLLFILAHWLLTADGFSCCRAWALECGLSMCHMDLVALQLVGYFWARNRTLVPCFGRWVLNHWTTREILKFVNMTFLCLIQI